MKVWVFGSKTSSWTCVLGSTLTTLVMNSYVFLNEHDAIPSSHKLSFYSFSINMDLGIAIVFYPQPLGIFLSILLDWYNLQTIEFQFLFHLCDMHVLFTQSKFSKP